MIRSLYIRVILTFLVSIIGGTIISFFVSTWIFEDKLNENAQINLRNFGQDIVRIYKTLPLHEADLFVSEMKQLDSYYIRIYEATGQFKSYGKLHGHKPAPVTMEQLKKVLDGGVVQDTPNGIATVLLGLPLKTEMGTKAIFLESLAPPSASFVIKWALVFATCSLIAGSLLILVASVFLVRPIKKLTKATKRIASGDFNVKLNIKQTSELGTLARSFEEMMHDLQQLEQMRREFVTNVSHEVQSPLTSISGYALVLKQAELSEYERSRYLDIIIAEAKRMSKMSDSLLKLSLLESQSKQLRLVTLSLDEQIRRIIVALQPQWSARDIHFELDLQTVKVTADHDLLNQVWTNILRNSIKFSEDAGVINVSIKQDIKNVKILISDTGIGIHLDDQKRIFERFFKADRSHSRKYDGSGMGLAIVKQIVSLHQGDIRVKSEPGQGTTFIVTLPITTPTD
ncbi:TPA: HAMP domain-containing histidine kinase [Bacillus cereus]|uniref:Heme sensor protein HssS n=1 Tax=Bacillus cereus TaxID=1396 RepID=A0A1D3N8I1_BACCE|nr:MULTISPECIES: HAMP domain-containing sensor histidine kinase [Bacillus]MCP1178910.1 HAMP domain-containing histidine kinase [Bacillus sp. 1663tsa1]MCP1281357.1 HAMP domain-containing histidine kinase [Bacillus sp. S0635]MCQ6345632.1 HAMP domain-containing histidine kinase [Bacillus cereus]MCU5749043.1 HAMP domain-containing histidine kinase [Bacillus cereus]MDA1632316.1 HAMP domain-containing sensor histidine kinase [Bacillus cereus]